MILLQAGLIALIGLCALKSCLAEEKKEHHRQTRQATQIATYVVDTLVVADDEFARRWTNWATSTNQSASRAAVDEYISLLFHQANVRLATVSRHEQFSVSIQPVRIIYGTAVISQVEASIVTGKRNSRTCLDTFRTWLVANQGPLNLQYDHAVLLTGYELESAFEGSGDTQGEAYVGTMCYTLGYSSSIVLDLGGFQGAFYLAHEVGHSLGATHDGERENVDCSRSEQYLMSTVHSDVTSADVKDNPWYFSTCSARAIANVIQRILTTDTSRNLEWTNCLQSDAVPVQAFVHTKTVNAGQFLSGTQQCQMLFGEGSQLCLGRNFGSLADICTSMLCFDTQSNRCYRYTGAEGTTCGDKQWCQMGQCTESESAPTLPGSCPTGDGLTLFNDLTCKEYVEAGNAWACYGDSFREECCQSCADVFNNTFCPYGDQARNCEASMCSRVNTDGTFQAATCCGTCGWTDTRRVCNDVATIDGMECGTYVGRSNTIGCYNTTTAFHCCSTCREQRQNVSGCEYGDYPLPSGFCRTRAGQDLEGCRDAVIARTCCATCAGLDVNKGFPLSFHPFTLLLFLLLAYVSLITFQSGTLDGFV